MITEREEYVRRCLNAAANLYGVLTMKEFVALYNRYAGKHEAPVSDLISPAEVASVAAKHLEASEREFETGEIGDDMWYRVWTDPRGGETVIAYRDIIEGDGEEAGEVDDGFARKNIARNRKKWVVEDLKVLPDEDAFLAYEDPQGAEECEELDELAGLIGGANIGDGCTMGDIDAMAMQAQMRINDNRVEDALDYMLDFVEYRPYDEDEYMELVNVLSRLESVTRAWKYRGYTQQELAQEGRLPKLVEEQIPTFASVFGDEEEDDDDDFTLSDRAFDRDEDEEEDEEFSYEREPEIDLDAIPPAKFVGPVDFKFVKDAAKREKTVADYMVVRSLTQDFVRRIVMHEMTSEERKAAAKRLGFDGENPAKNDLLGMSEFNRDIVAGDFGSMMDDQNGEPAIKRILAKKDKLSDKDRKAAEYYENYRYTWLEVQAVKAGVGLKCRDLLTGEDLFLMEMSASQNPNVKGMTFCAGIAPMGSVYLTLGVLHPANFENPATILKIVLTHLGLPTELPVRLSFAEQARFAAETIRRLDANGKFGSIHY